MLLEVVARSSAASSGTSGGSMHASLTPDYVQQLCEASDKSAARARTVQNLSWDLCLAKHLSMTPRVMRAIVTQVSACYIKIYVPQLPYLPDSLRRIPVRALCPSSVSCEDNESVIILSWGVKERAGAGGACWAGGDSVPGLGGGGCWILGSLAGSIARLGSASGADCAGSKSSQSYDSSKASQSCDAAGIPRPVDAGPGPESPHDGFLPVRPGGGGSLGHVVSRRIQLFDWVSVQLVGHVDSRGLAGPKLEALIVGDFAIPFDHRAHPLPRLVTARAPSHQISLPCARAADTVASLDKVSPDALRTPDPSLAHFKGQVIGLTRGMWSVVAHHMASAAAALPADAVVRLVGVSISGHSLPCHNTSGVSPAGQRDGGDNWCSARFRIPLEAVASLVGCSCGAEIGTEEQQMQAVEALCGNSEREPGLLCGMLCCVYAECADLFSAMGEGQGKSQNDHAAREGMGTGSLPPVSPVSSGPSPMSSQPSSGEHVATTLLGSADFTFF
jgi:hypothetical protein